MKRWLQIFDDPKYGKLAVQFSNGTIIIDDINMNEYHLIDNKERNGGSVIIPKINIYYTCETNVERSSIIRSIFRYCNNIAHSHDWSNVGLTKVPETAVIIETAIFDKNN